MLNCIVNDFIDKHISDKSIMIVATMDSILKKSDVGFYLKKWKTKYNQLDYGKGLNNFIKNKTPIQSDGILGAIRTIPYIYINKPLNETINLALKNTNVTHLGIDIENGVKALITALYMAKNKEKKSDIYKVICNYYKLNNLNKLDNNYNDIPICKNIIPYAILIFLNANSYEDCYKESLKAKSNFKSMIIISGTLYNLYYNKIEDENILKYYYTYCTDEIFELIEKFNKKYGGK